MKRKSMRCKEKIDRSNKIVAKSSGRHLINVHSKRESKLLSTETE